MKLKGIIEEDFTNYKLPSMFLITTTCDFKCCKELGNNICQNMDVVKQPTIDVNDDELIKRYLENPITKSIVFGGLEPFEQFEEVYDFIHKLRWEYSCFDPIVIYTGFYPKEKVDELMRLSKFDKIIVKFGRFIPDQKPHYDEVLGVCLISDNQWAEEL